MYKGLRIFKTNTILSDVFSELVVRIPDSELVKLSPNFISTFKVNSLSTAGLDVTISVADYEQPVFVDFADKSVDTRIDRTCWLHTEDICGCLTIPESVISDVSVELEPYVIHPKTSESPYNPALILPESVIYTLQGSELQLYLGEFITLDSTPNCFTNINGVVPDELGNITIKSVSPQLKISTSGTLKAGA